MSMAAGECRGQLAGQLLQLQLQPAPYILSLVKLLE